MHQAPFLDLSNEMGRQVAAFDWRATSLGPIEDWPEVLKITVGLVMRSGFPKCLCWGPQMIAIYNDAFRTLLGQKGDCLGRPFPEIWAESWEIIGPIAERAMQGHATFIPDFPLEISRRGGAMEQAFFTFAYSPVVDTTGRVMGFMDTVIETTGRVALERGARLRNRELRHRIKNFFSLISAVVSHTFREHGAPDEMRASLLGRLRALSRAQEVLSLTGGGPGTLGEVIAKALAPVTGGQEARFTLEGPAVCLSETRAFALTLALHELVTNSTKYGALSVPAGRVAIRWRHEGEGPLVLTWRETGGPRVEKVTTTGFGSFLIGEALAAAFDGQVKVDYPPEGLVLELTAGRPEAALAEAEPS